MIWQTYQLFFFRILVVMLIWIPKQQRTTLYASPISVLSLAMHIDESYGNLHPVRSLLVEILFVMNIRCKNKKYKHC